MTERTKTRENLRDVALAVSVAISLASALGVMIGKTEADAQWVQKTDGRLNAIEGRNKTADETNARWRGIVAQSVSRANFLCITNPECERLFGRIEVKEQ